MAMLMLLFRLYTLYMASRSTLKINKTGWSDSKATVNAIKHLKFRTGEDSALWQLTLKINIVFMDVAINIED